MRYVRMLGNILLWIGAVLGVVAGGVWIAGQLGYVQPLIVISGSMEPGIQTGDLLVDRPVATADIEPGDVVSIRSAMTEKLVTHRVVSVTPAGESWEIVMKGDANDNVDIETYVVGDTVLEPAARIPMGGTVVSKLMEPAVSLPIVLALLALLGLSLLDEPARQPARPRDDERSDDTDPDPADALDEIDRALLALGVDMRHIDDPFDDPFGEDAHETDHLERELVSSG